MVLSNALARSLIVAGAVFAGAAWAQTTPQPSAGVKPAAKPAAKPAPKPVAKAPALPQKLPPATNVQLAAAAMAHLGPYACEFDEAVSVGVTPNYEGYLDVQHRKSVWTMRAVLSSTGALRLEDVRGRMLMLQIANKSMLMDVHAGQRVVDGCVHEKQRDAAARPATSSLGLDAAAASAPR